MARAARSPTSSPRWHLSTPSWEVWTGDVLTGSPRASANETPRKSSAATRRRGRPCCRCCTWCSPRTVTSPTTGRSSAPSCSASARPRSSASRPSTPCTSASRRRLPRRRLHQRAVRRHGRRPDLGRAVGARRHRPRGDDRRRQGLAGAPGVQRGLRLRPGHDGQLGVLRQPDARVGQAARRRPAGRQGRPADQGAEEALHFKEASRVLAGARRPGGRRPVGGPDGQDWKPRQGRTV